jgi:hypothetical protein
MVSYYTTLAVAMVIAITIAIMMIFTPNTSIYPNRSLKILYLQDFIILVVINTPINFVKDCYYFIN